MSSKLSSVAIPASITTTALFSVLVCARRLSIILGSDWLSLIFPSKILEYFITIQKPMLETIQMSLIGTFFGAIIGLFMALFSSEVFVPKYVYIPMRFLGSILRAVPTLMYAAIFVVIFGSGAIAGIVAVTIFSFTIIAKMTF
jgi:phosphonate transport system permease protein